MFVAYHGPAQRFNSSRRGSGPSFRAKSTRKQWPGTFVWKADDAKKPHRHIVRSLPELDKEEVPLERRPGIRLPSTKSYPSDTVTPPTATIHLGGLRTDPFDTYPIKSQEYFPRVIDFYLYVISPDSSGDSHPFSIIMQSDVLFESVITMTMCMMPKCMTSPAMATSTLYHHGSALMTLNKRLSLPSLEDCASDAVILTVACLIATNASLGNNEKFDMHIRGLRQLVKLRGGLDCIPAKVSAIVLGAEALGSLSTAPRKPPPADVQRPANMEYPAHPLPFDLCAVIARLPEGIGELALTGRLSIQLIQRLDLSRNQLAKWLADAEPDKAQTEHWSKLIKSCTDFERMVWLSLVCYHLRSATYRSDLNKLADAVLERTGMPSESRAEKEWMLWTRVVLLGSSTQDLQGETKSRIAQGLFQDHAEALDWSSLETIAKKFYWNESLAAESRRYWLEGRNKLDKSHDPKSWPGFR